MLVLAPKEVFWQIHHWMTHVFCFSVSNIAVNISGHSIPNNIGIGNVSFSSVIVPISLESDYSLSHPLISSD